MRTSTLQLTIALLILTISAATPSTASQLYNSIGRVELDEANDLLNVPDDYETIQAAIDAAEDGDLVIVQRGDYHENIDFLGKNITVASEFINSGDRSDMFETNLFPAEERSVVAFANGETEEAQLIGFRIRNGHGTDTGNNQHRGGGLYSVNSGPTISNCYFAANFVNGEPELSPGRDDRETWCGGGIALEHSTASILNCGFEKNFSFTRGGGIYIEGQSDVTIQDCDFDNNGAAKGGGVAALNDTRVEISGCRFFQNTASANGGAIYIGEDVEGIVRHCSMYEGVAQSKGAGVYAGLNSQVRLERCLIFDNWAPLGTAVYNYNASTEIVNCTFHGNDAEERAGGVYMEGNGNDLNLPTIVNSIIWNNGDVQMYIETRNDPESLDFTFSDIQRDQRGILTSNGGYVQLGERNINADPRLVHPTWEGGPWDFNLLEDSPCIDAGTDIGMEFSGEAPDMGALEFDVPPPDIINVPGDYETIQAAIDAAEDGDLILVQRGDYNENIDFLGKIITVASEFINTGDREDMFETNLFPAEERSMVTFTNGETENAQLIGFRLRNGYATDTGNNQYRGGGVYCQNSGPTILNCYFAANRIREERRLSPNRDDGETWCGGGIALENSTARIIDCGFEKNGAASYGAGIYIEGQSEILIEGCDFDGNTSPNGAAVTVLNETTIEIRDCRFFQNQVMDNEGPNGIGGSIFVGEGVDGVIRNCRIYEGQATGKGGAIYVGLNAAPRIENCLIFDNFGGKGAAIYCDNAAPEIVNCTIHGNTTEDVAGAIYIENDGDDDMYPRIVNSIIWNNGDVQMYIEARNNPDRLDFTFSDIQRDQRGILTNNGGYVQLGERNLNADPRLVHPTWVGGPLDFNLLEDSPCIDAGTDVGLEFNGNAPDMGALESDYVADSVREDEDSATKFTGLSAYPNPFNPVATLKFSLSSHGKVKLQVFNISGRLVADFVQGDYKPGNYAIAWNAADFPTGIYLARLETQEAGVQFQRMMLIR